MRRRALVICLIGLVLVSTFMVQSEVIHTKPLDVKKLEPGDILFVDLYEGWSHGGFWDHMAIYVGEADSVGEIEGVAEATFDSGAEVISLDLFIERDSLAKFSVRRLGDVPGRQGIIQTAVDYALGSKGKPFDFTATATIPLKINGENMHCAEIVWRAFKEAGIDLDSNGGVFLYPDDIYFSPKLVALD